MVENADGLEDTSGFEELLMAPGLGVNMMLCDSAQAVAGKLYILGGGFSVIAKPQPISIGIQVTVPWDRANIAHEWRVKLIDEDGAMVTFGEKTVDIAGRFEAGRPAGLRAGTPLGVALAINLPALPLRSGVGYSFVLTIDGETKPEWRSHLFVRANQSQPT